jgi:hypothetical protein
MSFQSWLGLDSKSWIIWRKFQISKCCISKINWCRKLKFHNYHLSVIISLLNVFKSKVIMSATMLDSHGLIVYCISSVFTSRQYLAFRRISVPFRFSHMYTKCHFEVVSTPASYLGGPETGPPNRFFLVFLSPSMQIPAEYLKEVMTASFLPCPIHYSLIILSFDAI